MKVQAPRGYDELVQFYGDPGLWTRDDGTAHPAWESQMVTVMFPTPLPLGWDKTKRATRARVHNKLADNLEIVFAQLLDEGAWLRVKTYDGGYTWRSKRGSKKMSLHAFGGALDFNAATNGLGNHDFDMPRQVVSVFRRNGWTWGGQWRRPDAMHFQFGRAY